MAHFYLKPIFWNSEGYRKPSGVKATGGYPKEHGFGHEEWNNASFMSFTEKGSRFRAFHTESLRNTPVTERDGENFLFLYASHDGIQQLVGVIGRATCLGSEERRQERERLVQRLGINDLWRNAWEIERVRRLHNNDQKKFQKFWESQADAVPYWKCPEAFFFWPDKPVDLNPTEITGRQRLVPRFTSHHNIDAELACSIMEIVPPASRTDAWHCIRNQIATFIDEAAVDIAEILRSNLDETIKQTLIQARRGQGKFRDQVLARWGDACAVIGSTQQEVLRASHIRPWRNSSDDQRLDPANGLALTANLDALFDKGLISFDSTGKMLISSQVTAAERNLLGLPANLRREPDDKERSFLDYHQQELFRRDGFQAGPKKRGPT